MKSGLWANKQDFNWGAFDHASHASQLRCCNYYTILMHNVVMMTLTRQHARHLVSSFVYLLFACTIYHIHMQIQLFSYAGLDGERNKLVAQLDLL